MSRYINSKIIKTVLPFFLTFCTSCDKILNEKPDRSITTISNFDDLQAMLRAYDFVNNFGTSLADFGADDYILSNSSYGNLDINSQNAYKWDPNARLDAWTQPYRVVNFANTVLKEMNRVPGGNQTERDNVKGQALFFRSFAFYQLAQIYAKPYSETANSDPGIPLRLTPIIEEKIFRSSVADTYNQIIKDIQEAQLLMPLDNESINIPSKLACYGLLARVYLSMRDYVNAERFANLYLESSSTLIDYNSIDTLATPSIPLLHNDENTFIAFYGGGRVPSESTNVHPDIVNLYDSSDLRKKIFLKFNDDGSASFKGSYEGMWGPSAYCGIATDEMYLIRAECLIRMNQIEDGLADLNTLRSHRWIAGSYVPLAGLTREEAIDMAINERRKELLFRSTRWTDLRRLNLEGANIHLARQLDGHTYTLPANDKRWVWLIPEEVIKLSGINQNER